jgi:hypothetical protein
VNREHFLKREQWEAEPNENAKGAKGRERGKMKATFFATLLFTFAPFASRFLVWL